MKRGFDEIDSMESEESDMNSQKVMLVEREHRPLGTSLVNAIRVAKKSYVEQMELAENMSIANSFLYGNSRNKLDIIGRQIKSLEELMMEVVEETKTNSKLNDVACNFVKKPGHVYHLYIRPSGQKYFSMISPEEWGNAPHDYLGSWRLETDYSWTEADKIKYEGFEFLKSMTQSEFKYRLKDSTPR